MKYVDEVQSETVIEYFKEAGIIITAEQAKEILKFMYMLADIALDIAEEEFKISKSNNSQA